MGWEQRSDGPLLVCRMVLRLLFWDFGCPPEHTATQQPRGTRPGKIVERAARSKETLDISRASKSALTPRMAGRRRWQDVAHTQERRTLEPQYEARPDAGAARQCSGSRSTRSSTCRHTGPPVSEDGRG